MISATVTGRLGKDAEIRKAGTSDVLSFSVASESRSKVGGEWKKVTTWVSVSLFGQRAGSLVQHLTKGTVVAVRGALTLREYEAKGEKRTSLDLRADDVEMLGGGVRAESRTSGREPGEDDDDINF